MSLLFKVEKKHVIPYTETLLILPFKTIWERDESETKEFAIEDFSFIEFMGSLKKTNPYSGYNENSKRQKIIDDVITRDDWEEDILILRAIEELKDMQRRGSPTYNYYVSAKIGAEKMQDFFTDFNMTDVNMKSGQPLYKPKEITSALNDTSKVLQNLEELRTKVDNEVFEMTKSRGQQIVSPFADPQSLL